MVLGQAQHNAVFTKHMEPMGCQVELGSTLVSLKQDDEGVAVEIEKIVDGKTTNEHAKFAYVIGADGGHSTCFAIIHWLKYSYSCRLRAKSLRR